MVGHRNEKVYQDLGAMRHLALMLSLTFYSGLWPHLYQFLTPHFHILPTNTGPVPQLLTYLPTYPSPLHPAHWTGAVSSPLLTEDTPMGSAAPSLHLSVVGSTLPCDLSHVQGSLESFTTTVTELEFPSCYGSSMWPTKLWKLGT